MHVSCKTAVTSSQLSLAQCRAWPTDRQTDHSRLQEQKLHELDQWQADSRSDGCELHAYDILQSTIYVYRSLPFAFSD